MVTDVRFAKLGCHGDSRQTMPPRRGDTAGVGKSVPANYQLRRTLNLEHEAGEGKWRLDSFRTYVPFLFHPELVSTRSSDVRFTTHRV